jgi:hypothetical protein
MDLEARMDKFERRLDATLKIVQTGMKLLVKVQQENREFREETRRAINALVEAQMRTDAKLDRLVAALLRRGSNGHVAKAPVVTDQRGLKAAPAR